MNAREKKMGLPGMVLSGIAAVVGAIMYWAVVAQTSNAVQHHGFRLSTVGVILMIAGAAGFIASAIVFSVSRRSPATRSHTTDRVSVDAAGGTTEMHEAKS
jgi:phosphate/sulfate permease